MPAPYDAVQAMKYGWTAFTRNAAPFLVLSAVYLVIGLSANLASNLITTGSVTGFGESDPSPDIGEMLGRQAVGLGLSFVASFISWLIGVAMMRGALDVVDTGRTDLGAMFTRISWGSVVGAALLTTLAIWVGLVACILPGVVIGFLLWFVLPAVVDGESATGSLSASVRFTTGHLGETLLFFLLTIAISIAGACACGVGLLVAIPVLMIGMAYTWRVLQGRPVAP